MSKRYKFESDEQRVSHFLTIVREYQEFCLDFPTDDTHLLESERNKHYLVRSLILRKFYAQNEGIALHNVLQALARFTNQDHSIQTLDFVVNKAFNSIFIINTEILADQGIDSFEHLLDQENKRGSGANNALHRSLDLIYSKYLHGDPDSYKLVAKMGPQEQTTSIRLFVQQGERFLISISDQIQAAVDEGKIELVDI